MTALIDERSTRRARNPDWRVGFAEFARSYRRAFSVRPQLVAMIASRPVRTRHRAARLRPAFAAFARLGWDARTAATVMAAIDYLVLGSAIETFKGGFDRTPAEYEAEYPHLAAALRATGGDDIDDLGFELGAAA